MGRDLVGPGQAVVRVAPDDGVQVEAVGFVVAVEQTAGEEVMEGGVQILSPLTPFPDDRSFDCAALRSGCRRQEGGMSAKTVSAS